MARLILLPGLGADERMFKNLDGLEAPAVTPRHLVPEKGEGLDKYATRVANWLAINDDDVVGGSSFGGMVASAIARQRPVRGLVLVGSALDSASLGSAAALARFIPDRLLRPLLRSDRMLQKVFAPENAQMRQLARAMLRDAPEELLLYGGQMITAYYPVDKVPCPVFAIHGGRDPVMSPPPVPGCRLVADAGHGIAWTHGGIVGEFLRQVLDACAREDAARPDE